VGNQAESSSDVVKDVWETLTAALKALNEDPNKTGAKGVMHSGGKGHFSRQVTMNHPLFYDTVHVNRRNTVLIRDFHTFWNTILIEKNLVSTKYQQKPFLCRTLKDTRVALL